MQQRHWGQLNQWSLDNVNQESKFAEQRVVSEFRAGLLLTCCPASWYRESSPHQWTRRRAFHATSAHNILAVVITTERERERARFLPFGGTPDSKISPWDKLFVAQEREKTALGKIPNQKPEGITALDSSPIRDLCPTEHCVMPAKKRCVTLQFVGNLQVILSVFHSSVLSKEYLLFFSSPDAFVFTIKVSSFCSVLSPVTKHQTYCQTL